MWLVFKKLFRDFISNDSVSFSPALRWLFVDPFHGSAAKAASIG
jgi:hypothetical protein